MLYIFIDENKIEQYNGQPLKRFVGNKLVKVISNPTEEQLKEFGYMPLINNELPDYDVEKQEVIMKYAVVGNEIHEIFEIIDVTEESPSTQNFI